MTGWSQATARFDDAESAATFINSLDTNGLAYAEAFENIARLRKVGYNEEQTVLDLFASAGNGSTPIDMLLLASFNDTTDGGSIEVYRPKRRTGFQQSVGGAHCPEAARFGFRLEVEGLVETGLRATHDHSLEELLKEEARACAEEHDSQ